MTEKTNPLSEPKKSDRQKEADNNLVFSYLTMRNLIGISGILLPVVLFLTTGKGENDKVIESSISDYYYTSNGDILVVLLSVLGVFLFTYRGYKWQEKALTTVAAICALGIAFSPTASTRANSLSIHKTNETVPLVFGIERHFVFAVLFFVALALISLIFFPKTKNKSLLEKPDGSMTQKAKRNIVYKICGWLIIACILLIGLYVTIQPASLKDAPVIFILETVAIWAFGLSWLTKGETLLPDGEHYMKTAYRRVVAELSKTK